MRYLFLVLLVLLLFLQFRLWVGEGSFAEVWRLNQDVAEQKLDNARLRERNEALDAEVKDLKQGLDAIEERAREELGMIKEDEIFYQIIEEEAKPSR
ncbi:MAG: cell division protein FtsB [Gammaproteobacteria bacterium]|nr:cell division protein FtsB [Gammaproteobacteria bacterium]